MVVRSRLKFGTVALALALAGCQFIPFLEQQDEGIILVGHTLTGETCEARPAATAYQAKYRVYCEGWNSPSAQLVVAKTGQPPLVWAQQGAWREDLDNVAACAPGRNEAFGDVEGIYFECRLNRGGWPYFAFLQEIDNRIYAAHGVPTAAPVVKRLAAVTSGSARPEDVQNAPITIDDIRRLEAQLGQGSTVASSRDIGAAENLRRLGYRYSEARLWDRAIEAHQEALEIQRSALGPDDPSVASLMSSVAQQLSAAGSEKLADRMFADADAIAATSPTVYQTHLSGKAFHEYSTGNLDEAIDTMKQAEDSFIADLGSVDVGVAETELLLPRIDFQLRQGLVEEAKSEAVTAVLRLEEVFGPTNYWVTEARQRLARVQQEEGNYLEAVDTLEGVLRERRLLFGAGPSVAGTYRDIAAAHYAMGGFEKASEYYAESLRMLASSRDLRRRLRPDDLGSSIVVVKDFARFDPEAASEHVIQLFELSQLPTGTTASESISRMAARVAAEDAAIRALVRDFQDVELARAKLGQVISARFGIEQEPRRPGRACRREHRLGDCTNDELRDLVVRADQQLADLDLALQSAHPKYVKMTVAAPVSAGELAEVMRPTEALVHIVSTSWNTLVFVTRNGNVRLHIADMSLSDLEDAVAELRVGLDWFRQGRRTDFDVQAAHHLYQTLFGPLEGDIATAEHLIIVGNGPVLSMPFGVLVTDPPQHEELDYRQIAWLARRHAISLLPTVRSFFDLRSVAGRSTAPLPFIGFADPAFDGTPGDVTSVDNVAAACRGESAPPELVRSLPRLPETVDELNAIATSLGADQSNVVRGADATEARVKSTDLSQYRVVAFATHGLLPGELACQAEPALAFAPPSIQANGDDGLLNASEVLSLKLDADWVLLSACNTAGSNGKTGGESLSGLAQSFFFAGARSLLVSHWAVASVPTTEFTTLAIERYARDPSTTKAEALRISQLAMMSDPELAHPFFWAPFSLIGDGGQSSS